MALNGLDNPNLTEAYQSALNEAGGWFILRYVSRDEVDILESGKGGLLEARNAVASYDKRSPLYGFLLYRRRKVLIKYIPEGTSRLLQARVTVHFQAITDKFSPYDSIFPISAPEDLNDMTLTAACALHTEKPPGSSHATASSPRKKLDEIAEDAEETEEPVKSTFKFPPSEGHRSELNSPLTPLTPSTELLQSPLETTVQASLPSPVDSPAEDVPILIANPLEASGRRPSDTPLPLSRTSTLQSSYDYEPRASSQTLRPSPYDLSDVGAFAYKPKVKLGPRPKQTADTSDGRPKTAGARPVSTLPAGLKLAPRKTTTVSSTSRDSGAPPNIALPPPPPIPTTPTSLYPQHSPVSVRSLPAAVHRLGSPGITPEKQRLMKAVEMRKKQMRAKQERDAAEAAAAEATVTRAAAAEDPLVGESLEPRPSVADAPPPQVIVSRHSEIVEEPPNVETKEDLKHDSPIPETSQTPTEEDKRPDVELEQQENVEEKEPERLSTSPSDYRKSDSAIEMPGSETTESEEQSSIATASSPTSIQGSTTDQSTRPSSISEEDILPSSVYVPPPKVAETPTELEDSATESDSEQSHRKSIDSTPTVVPEEGSPAPSDAPNELRHISLHEAPISENITTPNLSPSDEREDPVRGRGRKKPDLHLDPPSSNSRGPGTSSTRPDKRRAMIGSLPTSDDNSDNDYLSDEEFMAELQSATVQQAKPVSVSKSPISPFFPNQRKGSIPTTVSIMGRPGSSPEDDRLNSRRTASGRGVLEIARSFSGGSAHSTSDHVPVFTKPHLSTGISQRIKALAEKSSRDSVASIGGLSINGEPGSGSPHQTSQSPPSRKGSINSINTVRPPTRLARSSVALFQSAVPAEAKNSMAPPPRETVHATVYNVEQNNFKPDSVSVTARIIRDDRTKKPDLSLPTDHSPLELHQSPLIIDHQPASHQNLSRLSFHSRTNTIASMPVSPISVGSKDSSNPNLPRSSSETGWRSLGRRRSDAKSPSPPLFRNRSDMSLETHDEEAKDKKKSRTSRLMKRMSSSLSSASRKSLAQVISPARDDDLSLEQQAQELASVREPPPAIEVGDLNVQFPDTLLWKRRYVEIDGQGNLVMSVSKTNDNVRGVTKRFHLTELRSPYIPDLDRQELPHSVMLDFLDGSTLQCACETYAAQVDVLRVLREAHSAWLAFST